MKKLREVTAIVTMFVILSGFACGKADVTKNASNVLAGLRAATPLISQLLPAAGPKLEQAIAIAEKLNNAVAANSGTEAVGFLRQLIPTFESIVQNDIKTLPVESQTKVLAVLAIVNIGLSFLANYYVNNPVAGVPRSTGPDVIAEYATKEVWGERFKK